MMEWTDAHPKVEVPPGAYQRLLGYPAAMVLEGRGAELAEQARAWYAAHGRPWIYAREAGSAATDAGNRVDR